MKIVKNSLAVALLLSSYAVSATDLETEQSHVTTVRASYIKDTTEALVELLEGGNFSDEELQVIEKKLKELLRARRSKVAAVVAVIADKKEEVKKEVLEVLADAAGAVAKAADKAEDALTKAASNDDQKDVAVIVADTTLEKAVEPVSVATLKDDLAKVVASAQDANVTVVEKTVNVEAQVTSKDEAAAATTEGTN